MARKVKDKALDSRAAREKLKPRGKPYWRLIETGLHLGYRRLRGKAGTWCLRHYLGHQTYEVEALAAADDFSDADGKTILDFTQAQNKARERMTARANGDAGITGPYTVNDACDDYLEYLSSEGRSDSAIKDARYRIDAFILPMLGKFEVAALRSEQLRSWRAAIAKAQPRVRTRKGERQQYREIDDSADAERRRKTSANRVLTTLKALLNHAFDEEKVQSNKAWGRRVAPFEGVEAARVRFLQVDECRRLVNASSAELKPMIQAALMTGARYSELARLRVADFDRDAGTVFVQESKTGRARHIRLGEEAAGFFRQQTAGRAGDELMFRKNNGGPWLKSHQKRPMAEACARAKITPPIGFHTLRHCYASLMVKDGAPLHIVALNLGHASRDGQPDVRMVTRHYSHLEPTHVAQLVRRHAPKFGFKPDRKVTTLAGRR
jgi:integrase